ncbi:MAG: 30S ribosomal protein S16 [Candidatus Jorgensenbacteria bacterium GW2011_GWA1_48_13]|nr:MAG: 30S ribosomal protein S16 [Candidatus Jorgensenbacteria bacterium GW2011_GWA1_48_13]
MLAIKFRRQGKKHQASFRLIVTEKRSKLGGRFIDDLGWLDPKSKKFEVKKEKAERWLKVGARPTPSVHNFLVRAGISRAAKIPVHKRPKKTEEVAVPAETVKETAPVAEAAAAAPTEAMPTGRQAPAENSGEASK